MRHRLSYFLLITVLVLMVGFASLSASLDVKGTTAVSMADFDVYYSNVLVNGVQDITVVESATELKFTTKLSDIDEVYELTYTVTNGSENYDAYVDVTCTGGNDDVTIVNTFDSSTVLEATKSRTGVFLLSLDFYTSADVDLSFTCKIVGEPVETSVLGEDDVDGALSKCKWEFNDIDTSGTITVGDEYTYCTEKFNVISSTDHEVKLLAKYNLGTNYRQSTVANPVSFSDSYGWDYTPGPKEIDIQDYDGSVKTYINEYVNFFERVTDGSRITGDLITLQQLEDLKCVFPEDYTYVSDASLRTCDNSPYKSWIRNYQHWWTRSAVSTDSGSIWRMDTGTTLNVSTYNSSNGRGVRPVLTISLDILNNIEFIP